MERVTKEVIELLVNYQNFYYIPLTFEQFQAYRETGTVNCGDFISAFRDLITEVIPPSSKKDVLLVIREEGFLKSLGFEKMQVVEVQENLTRNQKFDNDLDEYRLWGTISEDFDYLYTGGLSYGKENESRGREGRPHIWRGKDLY